MSIREYEIPNKHEYTLMPELIVPDGQNMTQKWSKGLKTGNSKKKKTVILLNQFTF